MFYDSTHNICYNSESDYAENNLPYIEDNIYKTSCSTIDRPYKAKFTVNNKDFYRCYNKDEYKNNGCYYYFLIDDSKDGECWVKCLGTKIPNENGTDYKHQEDNKGNTCTSSCSTTFPKLSNNVCKKECPQKEFYS